MPYNPNGQQEPGIGDSSKLSIEELDRNMKLLKIELVQHAEKVSMDNAERLIKDKSQSEMLLEGRTQAFAVNLEKKYNQLFKNFRDDVLRQQSERNMRFSEQYDDFQNQINKGRQNMDQTLAKIELRGQDQKKWMEMQT